MGGKNPTVEIQQCHRHLCLSGLGGVYFTVESPFSHFQMSTLNGYPSSISRLSRSRSNCTFGHGGAGTGSVVFQLIWLILSISSTGLFYYLALMKTDGSQHGDCCQGVCLPLPALTQSALLLLVILIKDSLGPSAPQASCTSLICPGLAACIFCMPSRVYGQLKEPLLPSLQTSPCWLAVNMTHLHWILQRMQYFPRNYHPPPHALSQRSPPLPLTTLQPITSHEKP